MAAFQSSGSGRLPRKSAIAADRRIGQAIARDETIVRRKFHGDIFPLTWLSDGRQFSSLSDGYGWGVDAIDAAFYNTNGVWVTGGPLDSEFAYIPQYPSLVIEDPVRAARYYGFSALAVDGVVYHFLSSAQEDSEAGWGWNGVKVIYSKDGGRTWNNQNGTTPVRWEPVANRSRESLLFYKEPNFTFSLITHAQMGKDYSENADGYVYAFATNGNIDGAMNQLVLARVKKARILDRNAYEFFAGHTRLGNVMWEREISRRDIVHTFPEGWVNKPKRGQNVVQSWLPSVVYNAPLGLYMMASSGVGCPSSGDWFGDSRPSYLGLWVAAAPWGPWEQIYETKEWCPAGDKKARCYSPQISPKWLAADGKSFWMIWSDFQSVCSKSEDQEASRLMQEATSDSQRGKISKSHFVRCRPYYGFNAQRFDLKV